ncbi:hypothetical protein L484_015808 [Morus notabilis]|uniref:Uncharacterized protein n=1 Tax=Morus notabilis TaxID=981085 RepID=W9S2N0_9ROSA|nr:hypothetical protein L484_015808 [Morus notabilis]
MKVSEPESVLSRYGGGYGRHKWGRPSYCNLLLVRLFDWVPVPPFRGDMISQSSNVQISSGRTTLTLI